MTGDVEGVGLFRTELLFLDRTDAPAYEEQVAAYAEVFAALPGRKVVVRTLDAGADKPLPFLRHGRRAQPGARRPRPADGSWRSPDVLDDQLDGDRARPPRDRGADVWVMAPMVATPAGGRGVRRRRAAPPACPPPA